MDIINKHTATEIREDESRKAYEDVNNLIHFTKNKTNIDMSELGKPLRKEELEDIDSYIQASDFLARNMNQNEKNFRATSLSVALEKNEDNYNKVKHQEEMKNIFNSKNPVLVVSDKPKITCLDDLNRVSNEMRNNQKIEHKFKI